MSDPRRPESTARHDTAHEDRVTALVAAVRRGEVGRTDNWAAACRAYRELREDGVAVDYVRQDVGAYELRALPADDSRASTPPTLPPRPFQV